MNHFLYKIRTTFILTSLVFVALSMILPVSSYCDQASPLVFSSWEGLEVDKCASIWLIKRFVDPDALFVFFKKSDPITHGIQFDTPTAQFRRRFNKSTFESMVKHYGVTDPKIIYIGRIIHDIEVNTWESKKMAETLRVQSDVNQIIWDTPDHSVVIKQTDAYFDRLYATLKNNQTKK